MRIEISEHAVERLKERISCHPSKYMKLAVKAWKSTEKVTNAEIANRWYYENDVYANREIEYRKLMGRVFIFDIKHDRAVLVTVYSPRQRTAGRITGRGRLHPDQKIKKPLLNE